MFSEINSGGTPFAESRVLLMGYTGFASFKLQKLARVGVSEELGDCKTSSFSSAVSSAEGAVGRDQSGCCFSLSELNDRPKTVDNEFDEAPSISASKSHHNLEVAGLCKQMALVSNSLASCMSFRAW